MPWNLNIQEVQKLQTKELTTDDIEQIANKLCPHTIQTFKLWTGKKWISLFEAIGYTLYPKNTLNKAFLLTGRDGSGKTTFTRLLVKVLGKESIRTLSPYDFVNDKYAILEIIPFAS